MPVTKNALIRYSTIDKCLNNTGRNYSFDDILQEVNDALLYNDPKSSGISVRSLRYDLNYMSSAEGYDAPIELFAVGRKRYYRYEEKFSIHDHPLNESERMQMESLIQVLRKFEGRPEFEFLNELGPIFADKFGALEDQNPIIGYESNIDYSGSHWIPELFNAIANKRCLEIQYRRFSGEDFTNICHPYYIKQFNNRWFLFAGRDDYINSDSDEIVNPIWNFPLDRIVNISEVDNLYINSNTDWEDYFYDIIGVTNIADQELEEVKLEFTGERAGHVITKPLHPSQKVSELEDGKILVRLKIKWNKELETLIRSFGKNVKVLSPNKLKENIKFHLIEAIKQYED